MYFGQGPVAWELLFIASFLSSAYFGLGCLLDDMSVPTKNTDSGTRRAFSINVADENKHGELVAIPLSLAEILLQQYWAQLAADDMEFLKLSHGSRFQEQIDVPGLVTDRPWLLPTVSKS